MATEEKENQFKTPLAMPRTLTSISSMGDIGFIGTLRNGKVSTLRTTLKEKPSLAIQSVCFSAEPNSPFKQSDGKDVAIRPLTIAILNLCHAKEDHSRTCHIETIKVLTEHGAQASALNGMDGYYLETEDGNQAYAARDVIAKENASCYSIHGGIPNGTEVRVRGNPSKVCKIVKPIYGSYRFSLGETNDWTKGKKYFQNPPSRDSLSFAYYVKGIYRNHHKNSQIAAKTIESLDKVIDILHRSQQTIQKQENMLTKVSTETVNMWEQLHGGEQESNILLLGNDSNIPVKMHKCILMSASPVFRRVIDLKLSKESPVSIPVPHSREVILGFKRFIYSNKLENEAVFGTLALASEYKIECLKRHVEKIIASNISFSCLHDIVIAADRWGSKSLLDLCTDFLNSKENVSNRAEYEKFAQKIDSNLLAKISPIAQQSSEMLEKNTSLVQRKRKQDATNAPQVQKKQRKP